MRSLSKMPTGLLSGILFFAVVLLGSGYIVLAKLHTFSAVLVTSVPVLIMIAYAALLGIARLFRLRDDQSGDNLYYMGFLFTLTSLAVSLYQFSAEKSAEQIVQNFGIAIASTIAGITLRILFNQMRRDPIEVEATARLELAEASRRVKRELDGSVLDFAYFRRACQQSISDTLAEVEELVANTKDKISTQLADFAKTTNKPMEDAYKASGETITNLNRQVADTIEAAAGDMSNQVESLSVSTAKITKAIDTLIAKLTSMQTPDNVIEIKLQPMIQGLTRAINALDKSVEAQSGLMHQNSDQAQSIAVALSKLAEDFRRAEARSIQTVGGGPWGRSSESPDSREPRTLTNIDPKAAP
jgi:hypothetical protein